MSLIPTSSAPPLDKQIYKDILKDKNKTDGAIKELEDEILGKCLRKERISAEEALFLWRYADFRKMGIAAHSIREEKTSPDVVTYTVFRIVNYTSQCVIECNFCSFVSRPEKEKGYTLSPDEILEKVKEAYALDAKQLFLQGGVNLNLPFSYYLDALSAVKNKYPDIHIRAFSPVEILYMQKQTGKSFEEIFQELKNAGMDSFPGAGAEILTDRMRNILSEKKISPDDWVMIMKKAHENGLPGSANIVWGSEEYDEELIYHLSRIRNLQDKTGGLLSFVPWTFQPQTKNFKTRHVSANEYLKMVALCRLYLDNIVHIETSLLVAGPKIGELALYWGADDINSPVIEENVLRSHGLKSIQEAEDFIQKAGFLAKRRNFVFEENKIS
ncbi:MAG: CofH family radical SAM protein [Spirochaetia bacterium]|nr:CofH family radical SAM protein [Spirochaetia bacterium]